MGFGHHGQHSREAEAKAKAAGRRNSDVESGVVPVLGIDLGTSYMRMGIWKKGDVTLIPNEHGVLVTPTCVAFTKDGVLVGDSARAQVDSNMENTFFAPQRLIGSRINNPCVQWYARHWPSRLERGEDDKPVLRVKNRGEEQSYSPEELVSLLLAHLRRAAEIHLGQKITDVVLTVPARYGRLQQEAIVEACRGAELHAVELIKAPTAAAVAYTLTNQKRAHGHVLVIDMGSSYFDFALVSVESNVITECAFGTDFVELERCMIQLCQEDLRERWGASISGDQRATMRLRRACEIAKRRLSLCDQARIEVRELAPSLDYCCFLSKQHFEELCKQELETLLEPIGWCLEDCGVERADVTEVVLVGGSAHIPVLKRAVREFFHGMRPMEVMKPENAAVLGATAFAAALSRVSEDALPELKGLELRTAVPWSTVPAGQADLEVGSCAPLDRPPLRGSGGPLPPKPQTRACFKKLASRSEPPVPGDVDSSNEDSDDWNDLEEEAAVHLATLRCHSAQRRTACSQLSPSVASTQL